MAYVKVYFRKDANELIQYAFEGKEHDDPVHGEDCPSEEEGSKKAFQAIREMHGKTTGLQAAHVIQSWSPQESAKLSREQVNKMGQELAARYFKGHQYLVVTHSHDDHLHNHIIVNTIGIEKGTKRITNKKEHLYKLRGISDDICRENGLSVIDGEAKDRQARMPDEVQQIERRRGNSYVHDMKSKADFARAYSTNFNEYAGIMKEIGVNLRITKEKITYYYQGMERGKRGDKLGKEYAKPGLEQSFKENREQFAKHPALRAQVRAEVDRVLRDRSGHGGNPGDVLLDAGRSSGGSQDAHKDFTNATRATGNRSRPGDDKLRGSIIPIDAIRAAKNASIVEYCERHKIELSRNDKGQWALKGREHVVITDNKWVNTRNKTKGTAIEFAAVHGNLTYLQAIARVNNTPSLLLLEKHFGEQKRKFTSFYVPRPHQADYPKAIERMGQFLKSFGSDPKLADQLLQSGQAEVRSSGVIRLFGKSETKHGVDFVEEDDGKWTKRKRGPVTTPFHSSKGTGKSMVVFGDPRDYIEKRGAELFADRQRKHSILALLDPNPQHVEDHVRKNPHIKEVELVARDKQKPTPHELDLFGNLKSRLQGIGVNVKLTDFERALARSGPEIEL